MLAHQRVGPIDNQHQGLASLQGASRLGQQCLLQLPHQASAQRGQGPGSAGEGDTREISCDISKAGLMGRHPPVGVGEGMWLLQLATQTGTEASEQRKGKTLVRAGP